MLVHNRAGNKIRHFITFLPVAQGSIVAEFKSDHVSAVDWVTKIDSGAPRRLHHCGWHSQSSDFHFVLFNLKLKFQVAQFRTVPRLDKVRAEVLDSTQGFLKTSKYN